MEENKYLLLGLGIGNKAIKEYFEANKIEYQIYDDFLKDSKKDIDYNKFDIIIKSSGIMDDHFILNNGRILNKHIISDLEFFYKFTKAKKIICVTGSNGKTTTVSLVKHLLDELDKGGNIGIPLGSFIESTNDIVVEASSFMLDYTYDFHANINLYTNIYMNHLDHHDSLKSYIRAKLKLIQNINKDDYLIYNYDDLILRRLFANIEAKVIPFSLKKKIGLYIEEKNVYYNNEFIYNLDDIQLVGTHNLYNILASIAVLLAYDKSKIHHLEKLKTFKTLDHRIEYIGKMDDIKVYNDSKSTNFNALKWSLNSFKDEKILLICGGKIKEDDFEIIKDELNQISFVIINGDNKENLADFFKKYEKDYLVLDNLIGAISLVKHYLKDVTIILFSPGSSSYDQFNNFEERGNFFKKKMQELYELKE